MGEKRNSYKNFLSLRHRVQNGSGTRPASYPMGSWGSFLGVKRPGHEADYSLPSTTEVKECVELYLHSPNMPSWRGAQLKKSTGTTLRLPLPKFSRKISPKMSTWKIENEMEG
jgi:hypothetical protein